MASKMIKEIRTVSDSGILPKIEKILGYSFQNKSLLLQAFTRRSFTNEFREQYKKEADTGCNEILELIGDSVLSTALLSILLKRHGKIGGRGFVSDLDEGDFTRIKKNLCEKVALSAIIDGLSVDTFPFSSLMRMSEGDRGTGNYNSPSPKEDLFESIIGAIALDCNMDFSVITPIIERFDNIERLTVKPTERDAKTKLKEYCEKRNLPFAYSIPVKNGAEHNPTYSVRVFVDGKELGMGTGPSIRKAEQASAKEALLKLGQ